MPLVYIVYMLQFYATRGGVSSESYHQFLCVYFSLVHQCTKYQQRINYFNSYRNVI